MRDDLGSWNAFVEMFYVVGSCLGALAESTVLQAVTRFACDLCPEPHPNSDTGKALNLHKCRKHGVRNPMR